MRFIDAITGQITEAESLPNDEAGRMWLRLEDAEPYFPQRSESPAKPLERTIDGRFDKSHLSPEHAYRINRDYLAHCIRYGWPMKVVRERIGVGGRIFELGCGREIPFFRTLTCDHSAMKHYKPSRYVGADLNFIKYRPAVNGINTTILSETNVVSQPQHIPDDVFDIVLSFEVLEHMDKSDGLTFLETMIAIARRKAERENGVGLILLSTPVNGGVIAKNHIYEWHRGELRRAFQTRGCDIIAEHGTFSNYKPLLNVLSQEEVNVWNALCSYHSVDVLSAIFSANHPEVARNVAWLVEVR